MTKTKKTMAALALAASMLASSAAFAEEAKKDCVPPTVGWATIGAIVVGLATGGTSTLVGAVVGGTAAGATANHVCNTSK